MYSLTDKGKQTANRTDTSHSPEEAIPQVMVEYPPGTVLEASEIAALLNMAEDAAEKELHRLASRGIVTNHNPSERSVSDKKRHVAFPKTGGSPHYGEEKVAVTAGIGSKAVGAMKGLGKAAIAAVKYINKDPKVVERAVIGNSAVVFGSQKRKQLGRDRDAVLRGRRH